MSTETGTGSDAVAARQDDSVEGGSVLANTGYEIFIAALSILSIVNLVLIYVVRDEALDNVLRIMNVVLSVILFLDFIKRLLDAPDRAAYFVRGFGWADLLASLPFPQFKVLRVFRLVRVYRLAREVGMGRLLTSLVKDRAGSALFLLLLVAVFVLEFGSLAMLRFEQYTEGANIETAQDAIWYVVVTISTVGYGDQYPVTAAGRILGTVIIVLGVGIFGTLTGFLANAFISPGATPEEEQQVAADAAADRERDEDLAAKVDDLHRLLSEQQATIARLEDVLRGR